MTIRITKSVDEDGLEWLNTDDLFKYIKEDNRNFGCYYTFVQSMADYLHYYNNNTSTAFGNPDLERMGGIITGFCLAKQWSQNYDTGQGIITIFDNRWKKLFEFEKPKVSKMEENQRKEIVKMWNEIL
jgi:hypothetical protein